MQTQITKLFNIEKPIVLPGMSWISTAELVAAVSNAGGLGILATGPLTAAQTRDEINKIRQLTDKPFGIGVTLLMPGAKQNAEIALELEVPVINFSLGKGDWIVNAAKQYGGKVIATVVTEKHALAAQKSGVDALLVTGHEAAAHGGAVTSLCLIPNIVDLVDIPVIAAGGFADSRGFVAALALGAQGVAMGSRFAASKESPVHSNTKQAIVKKGVADTLYSNNFDGLHARVMKTPAAEKACAKPMNVISATFHSLRVAKQMKMPLWQLLAGLITQFSKIKMLALFGAASKKIKQATLDGNLNQGVQFIGQSQGVIHSIDEVETIMDDILKGAHRTLSQLNQLSE